MSMRVREVSKSLYEPGVVPAFLLEKEHPLSSELQHNDLCHSAVSAKKITGTSVNSSNNCSNSHFHIFTDGLI